MKPSTIAALRDFAAAARHSPEPAQAVSDLALLIAESEAEPEPAPAPAPAPADPNPNLNRLFNLSDPVRIPVPGGHLVTVDGHTTFYGN